MLNQYFGLVRDNVCTIDPDVCTYRSHSGPDIFLTLQYRTFRDIYLGRVISRTVGETIFFLPIYFYNNFNYLTCTCLCLHSEILVIIKHISYVYVYVGRSDNRQKTALLLSL